jgi:hypothetical protein
MAGIRGTGHNSPRRRREDDLHPMKRNHNRQTGARACEQRKHLVEIQEKEPPRQDKTSQRAQDCPQSHAPALAAAKYNSTTTRPIDA